MGTTGSAAPILADGHVHITNRVYWENIDPWEPQPFGFDYARAAASGVNVVIENIAPYSYANFNYTARQTLRLIETFHRVAEQHEDKMGVALTAADARQIAGRSAAARGVDPGRRTARAPGARPGATPDTGLRAGRRRRPAAARQPGRARGQPAPARDYRRVYHRRRHALHRAAAHDHGAGRT